MESPLKQLGIEYWGLLVDHHDRKGPGWNIPRHWNDLSFEVQATTLLRAWDHILSPDNIQEEHEHHDWVALKFNAGWHIGEYCNSGPRKSHPMLRPFSDCPKWFQDVTGIFCAVCRDWKPAIRSYVERLKIDGFFNGKPAW